MDKKAKEEFLRRVGERAKKRAERKVKLDEAIQELNQDRCTAITGLSPSLYSGLINHFGAKKVHRLKISKEEHFVWLGDRLPVVTDLRGGQGDEGEREETHRQSLLPENNGK